MNKRSIKSLEKKLKAQQERIGKERDRLDDLISEYNQLKEDCDEAFDHLQEARDALSRLV